jgi:hypothetical protein
VLHLPRRARRGLVEASRSAQYVAGKRFIFRGVHAAASLKVSRDHRKNGRRECFGGLSAAASWSRECSVTGATIGAGLSAQRRAELARRLEAVIHGRDDHGLILDLGPADKVDPRVENLGKSFAAVTRRRDRMQPINRLARRIRASAGSARQRAQAGISGRIKWLFDIVDKFERARMVARVALDAARSGVSAAASFASALLELTRSPISCCCDPTSVAKTASARGGRVLRYRSSRWLPRSSWRFLPR